MQQALLRGWRMLKLQLEVSDYKPLNRNGGSLESITSIITREHEFLQEAQQSHRYLIT